MTGHNPAVPPRRRVRGLGIRRQLSRLQIGRQLFGVGFLAGLMLLQFASGLAARASASILLYAMGREFVLPEAVFGRFQ
ncbi:hypothetical protein AB4Y86_05420 [Arthrobacter sp. 2YAF22_2]|uniref:hypothetical protein n=1 Tax=Arthrobacter sp. 2YAF22_2 TaxID=3233029 RepID=UPI003F8DAC03